MPSNFLRLLPVLCSSAAFVLVMLALFAGNTPGVLEDYEILLVNTFGLGNDILSPDGVTSRGFSIFDDAREKANDKINDVVDKVTEKLNIPDFYTLHALAVCEGDFTEDGSRNITACHPFFSNDTSSISSLLDTTLHLDLGPVDRNISLADLGVDDRLASALDGMSILLKAVAIIFAIGVGCTGLSGFSSLLSYLLEKKGSKSAAFAAWVNLWIALGAFFFLALGGAIASIGAKDIARKINKLGSGVGVSAALGMPWVTLAWVGVLLMALVLGYWIVDVVRQRRKRAKAKPKPEDGNKKQKTEMELRERSRARRAP